jgi:hypothetical protein
MVDEPTASARLRLPWPIFVLDFEASALGMRSFPIEVGVASWPAFERPIEVWSTLIRPTVGWLEGGVWTAEAEGIHSISKADLAEGMLPADVMDRLNRSIEGTICWCDGGSQDDYWLGTLAHAAGVRPSFKLSDWDSLGGALGSEGYQRMVEFLERHTVKHRAGDDALLLLEAVAAGLGR